MWINEERLTTLIRETSSLITIILIKKWLNWKKHRFTEEVLEEKVHNMHMKSSSLEEKVEKI